MCARDLDSHTSLGSSQCCGGERVEENQRIAGIVSSRRIENDGNFNSLTAAKLWFWALCVVWLIVLILNDDFLLASVSLME